MGATVGSTTGYVLARLTKDDTPMLNEMLDAFALERRATAMRRKDPNVLKFNDWYERGGYLRCDASGCAALPL